VGGTPSIQLITFNDSIRSRFTLLPHRFAGELVRDPLPVESMSSNAAPPTLRRKRGHLSPRLHPVVPPGTDIGGYLVEKKLGAGGFGAVYRARRGGRLYALKLIPLWGLAEWAEREVAILLRLKHSNPAQPRPCELTRGGRHRQEVPGRVQAEAGRDTPRGRSWGRGCCSPWPCCPTPVRR